ncbi:MAG: DoxX family membrane protein [Patescibacteria group bacterium]|nr:DoxX family membrane protein [Patescibacteria group bacterium]
MKDWIKKNYLLLLRFGLAFIFLANSLTGLFNPNDFKEIVEKSFFHGVLDLTPLFIILVGINDLVLSILLFTHFVPKVTYKWATAWLVVVTVVIATTGGWGITDSVEHLGFVSIALVLMLTEQ